MSDTTESFTHISVLGEEAPEALVVNPDGLYIDATFGRGGHSRRILQKLSSAGRLIAFDRDPEAIQAAASLKDARFRIIHRPFSQMSEALANLGIHEVDGVFLDIGVSSPQIDDATRGFSFRYDGPLDMRMDTSTGQTAAEWLQSASEAEIKRVIHVYGEERYAGAIARAIVKARQTQPITHTLALANLVASVVPKNYKDPHQHPATRTFQAIRIEINHELDELRTALESATALLVPQGRLAVITFHSLEDRVVKQFFEDKAHPERQIDSRLPLTNDQLPQPLYDSLQRIRPSREEGERNPRSRSAILRVGVRTATPYLGEVKP